MRSDRPAIAIRTFVLALLALAALVASATAQLLPAGEGEKANSALETLLEEARRDGSTVIVVKPGASQPDAADRRAARDNRFLMARARIEEIFESAETLPAAIAATFANASRDGTNTWLWRGVLTALAGLGAGWLVIRPIIRWTREHFRHLYVPNPRTLADKAKYLLFRALLAVIYAGIFFLVAALVAIIADSGWEPTRRVIFEIIAGYCAYRLLRYGISWNLFAHDVSSHRIVNLTDRQAARIHHGFHWSVAVCLVLIMPIRFLTITAAEQNEAGLSGGMTADQILLLEIVAAALVILVVTVFTLFTWREWQSAFAPKAISKPWHRGWATLAKLAPLIWLFYSAFSFGAFVYRLAEGSPVPAGVIAAPYIAMWGSFIVYGLILIVIQFFYDRRQRQFDLHVETEKQRLAEEIARLDSESGEEMIVKPKSVEFEFQPIFRSFFENAALAIIATVALGELGRAWGIPVGESGNWWSAFLDMLLALILGWLAYEAVCRWVDYRLEQEGEAPGADQEEAGNEGGAGVSRMATLLPIVRYVITAIIIVSALVVILSLFGIDIGPLLASAGVVGIAVGFGAQKLIQDIFSGAFFLLDDAFRKGEYVEIEGIKGVVEKISIRSFQLRHHLGALHTIPFGEIRQLTNYSRDWVLMKLPLRVTYDTDVDRVRKLVKKLGQELLDHPQVGNTFLQPLKSQGVYKMEDSAMIIRVKFMTRPGEQFVTRKVVYEAIQDLFAREGINFAHKEVTVRLADGGPAEKLSESEKQAVASAARQVIDDEEALAKTGAAKDDDR